MIRRLDVSSLAEIALAGLRQWLVLAILLPPFNLLVAATTNSDVGRCHDLIRLFRLGIVSEGKLVLVGWGSSLLLLFAARCSGALRHVELYVGLVRDMCSIAKMINKWSLLA